MLPTTNDRRNTGENTSPVQIMGTTPEAVPPLTPPPGTPMRGPAKSSALTMRQVANARAQTVKAEVQPPGGWPQLFPNNDPGTGVNYTTTSLPGGATPVPKPPGTPPTGGPAPVPVPKPPGDPIGTKPPGGVTPMPKPPGTAPNPGLINPGEPAWGQTPGGNGFVPGAPYTGTGSTNPALGGSGGGDGGRVALMDYRTGMAENNRDAVTRTVTENELTSRQLERLLDENGRYIQNARLNAREQAANSGMLMSSTAAGAAQRAAIDAGAPIAQSDASVYANTASENMRAENEDAMADQGQGRQLFGQTMETRARLDDAQANRGWQSSEAATERGWRSGESALDREHQVGMQGNEFGWRSAEAGLDRGHQMSMQEMQQLFQRQEGETERQWRDRVQALDQQFTGQQNSLSRQQGRFDSYVNMQANREAQLAQTLAAIYSNPNLKPDQQRAAAENARALFTSMTSSFNAAFAQGVPPIFYNPYPMDTSGGGGGTNPATPPGSTPPGTDPSRPGGATTPGQGFIVPKMPGSP